MWRAAHTEKKAGILKVARGPTQIARVRREIEILRRLSHPAIVPIVDADVECDPPWLITAEGVPLVDVWDSASMTHDERFLRAQRMILHLAGGLDLAHKNGIVHRDVKPENVVLMRPHAEDTAALIDFGIAHDAQAVRLTEVGGRAVANQFAAPPEAYYGPLTNPPPWWDCLGLGWLWGWLISDEGREPKGGRYHWKYQPLMPHPRSESVRALIAVCSDERTAPETITGFLELAARLGIGGRPSGAERSRTAFTDAANQHAAAVAQKLLVEHQRREEVEGCTRALGEIYEGVIRDLNQIVEEVKVLGVGIRGDVMYPSSSIFDSLNGLGEGENTILWTCSGSTVHGEVDIRLIAHYDPVHESVWPIELKLACTAREIPNSRIYHRRDGTPVDPMGLSPTAEDSLQRALEWILNVMMTVGAP